MFKIELIICIKMDLVLNNLQRLICHKTQTTTQPFRVKISRCNIHLSSEISRIDVVSGEFFLLLLRYIRLSMIGFMKLVFYFYQIVCFFCKYLKWHNKCIYSVKNSCIMYEIFTSIFILRNIMEKSD